MQEVKCPICANEPKEEIFGIGDLNKPLKNIICKSCSLVFISPRMDKLEYSKYQSGGGAASGHHFTQTEEEIKKRIEGSDTKIKIGAINFFSNYIPSHAKVLDVGCGFGNLLRILKEKTKINGDGIELNEKDVQIAQSKFGLNVFCRSLKDYCNSLQDSRKYDFVILHHTFEHFDEPVNELGNIKKILTERGLIYIAVPNIMKMRKKPERFFHLGHAFSYSPYSINKLLRHSGFKIIAFNKNASYPGGMELIAAPEFNSIAEYKSRQLNSGNKWWFVKFYVQYKKIQYLFFRFLKSILLFWAPKNIKSSAGEFINSMFKRF